MVAEVLDLDADVVALRMIREQSPGVLPTPQRWIALDPVTYPAFGPSVATTARRVIGPRRQRKKGTPTGLTVAGGFNHDLTPTELSEIMEGVLLALKKKQPHHGGRFQIPNPVTAVATGYGIGSDAATAGYLADQLVFSSGWATGANNGLKLVTGTLGNVVQVAGLTVEASPPGDAEIRVVGYEFPTADVDVVNNAGELPRLVSTVTDMTNLGLVPGEWIFIGGTATANKFVTAANNGYARVRSVSTNVIEIDKAPGGTDQTTDMAAETGTGIDLRIFLGDFLKNEAADSALFDEVTWQLERTLGVPNPVADPGVTQAEYLITAMIGGMTMNVPLPGDDAKITVDLSLQALDHETRTGQAGDLLKTNGETVISPFTSDVFNPTSDVDRMKLSVIPAASAGDGAPDPLFAFITELTLAISNNIRVSQAITREAGFAVRPSIFTADAQLSAYFTEVASFTPPRQGDDVTFEIALKKQFQGRKVAQLWDVTLGTLAADPLDVSPGASITQGLTLTGAEFEETGHSLGFMEFWYLPD